MGWIDKVSRRLGEKHIKSKVCDEKIPGISRELDDLEMLRLRLIEKDEELNRTRLEWDRTFDSIVDSIVLIDRNRKITKANNSFYNCMEKEIGHVEFEDMEWDEVRNIMSISSSECPVDKCFTTGIHQSSIISTHGKVYNVSVTPVYINVDGGKEIIGVVRVSRDITKYEKTKESLARRSNIYHAISEMSKTLVNHENWNNAVSLILGDLGRAIGASRVYVFKNELRKNRICSVRQHVYYNDAKISCSGSGINDCINYDLTPSWKSRMEHGLPVEGSLAECQICPDKNKCEFINDVLVCAVPIFVKNECGVLWVLIIITAQEYGRMKMRLY